MRQAVMIQPGKIELNEVEEPVAGPGEILLRVKKLACADPISTYGMVCIPLHSIR